ncbi:hypothetical protein Hanom_Chr15g01354211 [Helianthus anomalus]
MLIKNHSMDQFCKLSRKERRFCILYQGYGWKFVARRFASLSRNERGVVLGVSC